MPRLALMLAALATLGTGGLPAQESFSKPEQPRPAADSPLSPPPPERRLGEGNPPPRADWPHRDGPGPEDGARRPGALRPPGSGLDRPFPPEGGRPFRGEGFPDGPPGNRPGMPGLAPNPPLKLQPFLGVITRPAPPELATHLRLPEGFGLVVEDVIGQSPAQKAGLQPNDLLRLLDDQWLVNPGQLEALVRRAGKDHPITLTLLRAGQEEKVKVTIEEKLLPVRRPLPQLGLAPDGGRDPFSGRNLPARPPTDAREEAAAPTDRQTRYAPERARMVRRDDLGSYRLERINGRRVFTARHADGTDWWHGNVDTEEERQGMPNDLRQRLELMEKSRPFDPQGDQSTPDGRPRPANPEPQPPTPPNR